LYRYPYKPDLPSGIDGLPDEKHTRLDREKKKEEAAPRAHSCASSSTLGFLLNRLTTNIPHRFIVSNAAKAIPAINCNTTLPVPGSMYAQAFDSVTMMMKRIIDNLSNILIALYLLFIFITYPFTAKMMPTC
jgi:hypothetical protein